MPPPPHHNFVIFAPMTMKFNTVIKIDVFYTMVKKIFVMSSVLYNYDAKTLIHEMHKSVRHL